MDSQVFLIATRLAYRQAVHISLLFQASMCLKKQHLLRLKQSIPNQYILWVYSIIDSA